jgi:hypothetical protein
MESRLMLENLDFDDLEAIADSLPGPHAWTHGTADIFYCQACHISFEFGAEPVPDGPCEQLDLPEGGVLIDGIDLDEFIRRYGRTEAERRCPRKIQMSVFLQFRSVSGTLFWVGRRAGAEPPA